METREGPRVTVDRSCFGCIHEVSEKFRCQGDSGRDVYCCHPSFDERKHVASYTWKTPDWCPCLPPDELATLRARVAELEAELDHEQCAGAEAQRTIWARDEEVARLREALKEIEQGDGPFSRDPLTHAENCIDNMKAIARRVREEVG